MIFVIEEAVEFDKLCEEMVPRMSDDELVAIVEGTVSTDDVVEWMLTEKDAEKESKSRENRRHFTQQGGSPEAFGASLSKPERQERGFFKKGRGLEREMQHHARKEMQRRGEKMQFKQGHTSSPSLRPSKDADSCPRGEKMVFGACREVSKEGQNRSSKLRELRAKMKAKGVALKGHEEEFDGGMDSIIERIVSEDSDESGFGGKKWAKSRDEKKVESMSMNGVLGRLEEKRTGFVFKEKGEEGRWPIGDKKHAIIAISYMKAGRGKESDYPAIKKEIASKYAKDDEVMKALKELD